MTTGLVWDEAYLAPSPTLPAELVQRIPFGPTLLPFVVAEHRHSLTATFHLLQRSGMLNHLTLLAPAPVTADDLRRGHTASYLAEIAQVRSCTRDRPAASSSQSLFRFAAHAVGGTLAAVQAVLQHRVTHAYALVRPAGHHAEADALRSICIFNNAVIAVRFAQAHFGLHRIALVDWDVHHGNGAQQAFYADPRVLTISLHQGQGLPPESVSEQGRGAGLGTNLNIPLPLGAGHATVLAACDQLIIPALERFRPELIVVASGYDGSGLDPLGRMVCSAETFRTLTTRVQEAAHTLCQGRLVLTHEGGYSPRYVPWCVLAVLEALTGWRSGWNDPYHEMLLAQGAGRILAHHAVALSAAARSLALIPTR